uniref:O-succinylhomoserine (Thiol)-lyase n=2 Tax=Oryza sativa subsp. japonica TaxID=39947 RepID=Q67VG6_ORYSJ|nr:putative O-succinylhomoserine (thiol)-lyase [Oryza sativa Japonica Group]
MTLRRRSGAGGTPPTTRSSSTPGSGGARAIGGVAAEVTDYSIATPIVTGTARWFRDSADLVAFREGGGRRRRRRHSFEYARYGNPTVEVLEDKISAMEKAEATIVTSSGMNAIVATLLAVVPPGGHVVATTDCYSEARAFIRDRLSKMGIRTTFVDLDDMEALQSVLDQGNVTMFYADSLTNPHLKCVDVRRVAELCHQRGALVCIDSTLASPINQKPLTLGADVVLHSHHQVIGAGWETPWVTDFTTGMGVGFLNWHPVDITSARGRLWTPLSPPDLEAYMIIRGLKTMALRVEAQNRTALRVARLLERHPKVERVNYPWLESSPWHGVARKQMTGAGGVISFEVASDMRGAMRFVDALELPFIATSLGGCESLVQQPAIMSYWGKSEAEKTENGIKDNLVRFSFGIEKFEDLKDDILQALEKI